MLRLVSIVVSIGLADSLNPSTIAPALYLATGQHSRRRVTEFTLAVFAVYLIGGAAVALGPGQLVISLLSKPSHTARYITEIVAGAAMLGAAVWLWRRRQPLSARRLPAVDAQRKSSAVLGATITAVELPTAFPYFAAIATIVGSGLGPVRQFMLLLLFNICFVLPLLAIILTLTFAGEKSERLLTRARHFLQRYWPQLLAGFALLAGVFVVLLGATGLAYRGHGRIGRVARGIRKFLHP